jgi:hypothetical protein
MEKNLCDKFSLHLRAGWFLMLSVIMITILSTKVYAISPNCLSKVEILEPVNAGTRIIAYNSGSHPCPILVFVNSLDPQNLVGKERVNSGGSGVVHLKRPLAAGETVLAVQDISGTPSEPRVVKNIPLEEFPKPSIVEPMECQMGFGVYDLTEGGVRVQYDLSGSILTSGAVWTPYSEKPISLAAELQLKDKIEAMQDIDRNNPKPSLKVSKIVQKHAPSQLPKPRIDKPVPLGADEIYICDLFCGAEIFLYEEDQQGNKALYAYSRIPVVKNGPIICATWPIHAFKSDYQYCVQQTLCGETIKSPIDCVIPEKDIEAPEIKTPICPGQERIWLNKTKAGVIVEVRVTRSQSGQIESSTADSTGLTTGVLVDPLKAGDKIVARQGTAQIVSPWSAETDVEQSTGPCEGLPPRPVPRGGPYVSVSHSSGGKDKEDEGDGDGSTPSSVPCLGHGSECAASSKPCCGNLMCRKHTQVDPGPKRCLERCSKKGERCDKIKCCSGGWCDLISNICK